MDWLGIGVFILSIGFAVMVFYLIPVFKNLTRTLGATADTITSTEKELEKITNETTVILHSSNETLANVNDKLGKLDPLFDVMNDAGKSAITLHRPWSVLLVLKQKKHRMVLIF